MPDARVTLRRRSPYATRSNKFKKVRTPGGKLTIHYLGKLPSKPKCGDTGRPLFGIAAARPKELMRISRKKKTVSRCYGGVLSAYAVRNRIVRAFLLEEQKIVKKVIKSQKTSKKSTKPPTKSTTKSSTKTTTKNPTKKATPASAGSKKSGKK